MNRIRNVGMYDETLALFTSITERGRQLNVESPPSMKNLWLCFKADFTDGEECTEILLRLRTDGPLSDRDIFCPPPSRRSMFDPIKKILSTETFVTQEQLMEHRDEQHLVQLSLKAISERDAMLRLLTMNEPKYLWIMNATLEELAQFIEANGSTLMEKRVVKMMTDITSQESVCVVDPNGNILPLTIKDEKLVKGPTPGWVEGMSIRKSGRTIAYGNPKFNTMVDRTAHRRTNQQQVKYTKYESTRLRREAFQNRRGFNDLRKNSEGSSNSTGSFTSGRSYDR